MKSRARIGILLAGLAASSGCAALAPAFTESDRAAVADSVRAFAAAYLADVNGGGFDRVLTHFADEPGFLFLENGRIAYDSHAAVAQAFDGMSGVVAEIRMTVDDSRVVVLAPGTAIVSALYNQVFVDTEGNEFEIDGAFTLVAVHRSDGWKWLTGHTSQPVPRPE